MYLKTSIKISKKPSSFKGLTLRVSPSKVTWTISSTILDQKAIYVFKLQVFDHGGGIFGICPSLYKPLCTKHAKSFAETENNSYGFGGAFGLKFDKNGCYEYGESLRDEDIIEMRVDKVNGTLSYKVNNWYYGIAFKIDCEFDYKFAACISFNQESFEMLNFYVDYNFKS